MKTNLPPYPQHLYWKLPRTRIKIPRIRALGSAIRQSGAGPPFAKPILRISATAVRTSGRG